VPTAIKPWRDEFLPEQVEFLHVAGIEKMDVCAP